MPDNPTVADMLFRHNLYVAGLREGMAKEFSGITVDIAEAIRDTLKRVLDKNLGELTKRDLNKLLAALRANLSDAYQANIREFMRDARKFVGIERQMYQGIFRTDTGSRLAAPSVARLWATVQAETISATGATLAQSATAVRNSTVALVERMVRAGHADQLPAADVLRNIIGTKSANYRDGSLKRVGGWSRSFADTALAHTSASINHDIAERYYDQYQWVSVIDEATTDVCIERDGQIYEYGKGPVPPAHYNCRSEIVPVSDNQEDMPASFASWLETQPGEMLSDLFKAGDRSLDNVKVITLDRFKDKLEFVLI